MCPSGARPLAAPRCSESPHPGSSRREPPGPPLQGSVPATAAPPVAAARLPGALRAGAGRGTCQVQRGPSPRGTGVAEPPFADAAHGQYQ